MFIRNENTPPFDWQFAGNQLTLHACRFDATQFDGKAFAAARLAQPPHIGRSVRKRQAEYFYGRLAARSALLHAGLPEVDIDTGAQREPVWPPGVIGSITHNAHWAAAVVLPAGLRRGIGIDIESRATAQSQASIAAMALDAAELDVLAGQCSALDRPTALTLVFSAKESFYKAVHAVAGRYFGFEAIRLKRFDGAQRQLEFTVIESLGDVWQPGATATVHYQLWTPEDILTAFVW